MDIVVIGSGVSATLLAQSLVRRGCFRTLRVIDRPARLRAHRFAYWADFPTPFDAHVDAEWSTLRIVDAAGAPLDLPLTRLTYRTFPTARWYADAQDQLRRTPGVDFVDARVDSVELGDADAVVHASGARHRADWVFSSAPLGREKPQAFQRFEGWEIALRDRALDCGAAIWMDFRTPDAGDFRFMYALPLGPDRLLVEHVSHRPADHGASIRAYLGGALGLGDWEVIDREAGATPLYAVAPARGSGRLVRLGVAGGLAKTCTGYALLRMWRDAEAIADGLAHRGRPPATTRPSLLYRTADRFFLDLLARSPERLREFLPALARRASGDALLAFLDERASWREQIEVARAAPGWLPWWIERCRLLRNAGHLPGIPPHGRAGFARRP